MRKHGTGDLCGGIGGIGLAFALEGVPPAWACDLDEVARDTYEANHGIRPLGDIWDIDPDEVPDADVVCMGMPCPPFSTMGRHGCWDDHRSHVLAPLMRLLCRREPRVVVIENVAGMTHEKRKRGKGRPIDLLVRCLEGCGYAVSSEVLDAAKFGGCQHRPRVFVVGDIKGRQLDFSRLKRRPHGRVLDVLEPSRNVPSECWLPPDRYVLLDKPSPPTPAGMVLAGYVPGRTLKGRTDVWRLSCHHHTARIYDPSGVVGTLMCRSGLGLLRVGRRVRVPTVLELQRLQGFPDDYVWPHGDLRRHELLGQSVHVPTVRAVAAAVRDQLL